MKIRIQGNTIRLRLTQPEIDLLKIEGRVEQSADFGSETKFHYSISFSPTTNEIVASFKEGHIGVEVPQELGKQWIDTTQTGIENGEYANQGSGLKILVEKDFQCLHERKDEDESEAFPNPMAKEENV